MNAKYQYPSFSVIVGAHALFCPAGIGFEIEDLDGIRPRFKIGGMEKVEGAATSLGDVDGLDHIKAVVVPIGERVCVIAGNDGVFHIVFSLMFIFILRSPKLLSYCALVIAPFCKNRSSVCF